MKKVAIITGASSGIGEEFALKLDMLENYDEMWLIARNEQNLNRVAATIKTATRVIPLDLTEYESYEKFKNILESEKPAIKKPSKKYGFVSVCLGDGIADAFRDIGVDTVVVPHVHLINQW